MNRLFQPTLVRRVVLALLLAFAVVWIALLINDVLQVRQTEQNNPNLIRAATQLIDMLGAVDDPLQARSLLTAIDRSTAKLGQEDHIPGSLLLQLWDRRTHSLVFSSSAAGQDILHGDSGRQTTQILHGDTLYVVESDSPHWTVVLAHSRLALRWVLETNALDLIRPMLIAFPLVLVPVWLAVSLGLRPLSRLSNRISARGVDDLSPIGVDSRYAELKPVIAALDGLLAKLSEQFDRERAFVQDAAHELRTPMAVIAAQAHVLEKAIGDTARREAAIHLQQAIGRCSHLVHQLLALESMGAQLPQDLAVVDIAQLTRDELVRWIPAASQRQIECSLEAPDRLMQRLEVSAYQSVVTNLVDNAIRYANEGGRIVIELLLADGTVRLSVADDGPGIGESDRSRVFERFYRGRDYSQPGSGLGLAIVRQAAGRLRGHVSLGTGLDGRGCRFTARFPATPG
jgi:two-component system, OmpR family, sensor histidine kinase QseC